MSVSQRIRDTTAESWTARFDHPFVKGLGRGDLDEAAFRRFIVQDHLLLADHVRVLAMACFRTADARWQSRFAQLLVQAIEIDRPMHQRMCIDWGMSSDELERAEALPATLGYGSFLVRTATTGDLGDLAVSLLVREWCSTESAQALRRDGLPHDARYATWIDTCASPARADVAEWLRAVVDHLGEEADDRTYLRWRRLARSVLRYEIAFLDMAWSGDQTWPA